MKFRELFLVGIASVAIWSCQQDTFTDIEPSSDSGVAALVLMGEPCDAYNDLGELCADVADPHDDDVLSRTPGKDGCNREAITDTYINAFGLDNTAVNRERVLAAVFNSGFNCAGCTNVFAVAQEVLEIFETAGSPDIAEDAYKAFLINVVGLEDNNDLQLFLDLTYLSPEVVLGHLNEDDSFNACTIITSLHDLNNILEEDPELITGGGSAANVFNCPADNATPNMTSRPPCPPFFVINPDGFNPSTQVTTGIACMRTVFNINGSNFNFTLNPYLFVTVDDNNCPSVALSAAQAITAATNATNNLRRITLNSFFLLPVLEFCH